MNRLDIDTFPLTGVRLIEASAGTGKTFTIAAVYLRLLLDAGRDLREILVVTFTEAATEELRDRIRRRIRDAADAFARGEADDDPVLEPLLARHPDHRDCERRLRAMLTRMDEAPIHTIHGFCNRTLHDNAFESGSLFRADFITDEGPLREALTEDFWRRHFYESSADYVRWVRSRWKTPSELLKAVSRYLNRHRLDVVPEPNRGELDALEARFQATAERLADLWTNEADDVRTLLEEAVAEKTISRAKDAYKPEHLDALRPQWEKWLAAPHLPLPKSLALLTNEGLENRLQKPAAKAGRTPPAHPVFDQCSELHRVAEALATARGVDVLYAALTELRQTLRERKREEQVLSFDDLLTTLADALRGPRGGVLADAVARRHPVALIDEFQDTDPEQYEIFRRIYADRADAGLFMIGDPKQAIYSFRGADIFTYLAARRATDADDARFTLGRNFRSTDSLVRGIDTLFRRNPRRFIFDEGIDLPEVEAAGVADERPLSIDGNIPAGLQVWFERRGQGEKTLARGHARTRLADACATEIARLLGLAGQGRASLGGEPLASRHMAVLVRSHTEAEEVKRALDRQGIASVHHSRQSVFETEEAVELGRILRAVAEPENERLLRAAVCTRLMGLGAAAFHEELQQGQPWEERMERFAAYRDRWERRGFLPMLHTLMHEQGIIDRVFALADGERRMTNLLHAGELLQGAATEHYGITGLLRWFQQQLDAPTSLGEAAELRLESDEALVKIVTIHKSKGLQYPVVFLPFMAYGRAPTDNDPALFHDAAGELVLDLGTVRQAQHRAQARRERLAEDLRLLYVALTRASHCCYLAWGRYNGCEYSGLGYLLFPPDDPDAGEPMAQLPEDDETLQAVWGDIAAAAPDTITVGDPPTGAQGTGGTADTGRGLPARGRARPLVGPVRQGWRLSSYSGLLTSHAGQLIEQPDHDAIAERDAEATEAETAPGHDIFGFPRGASAGTFLHRVLELADFTDLAGLAPLVERLLPAYGFDAAWSAPITEHLQGVLATAITEGGLRLADLGAGQRLDEMAFFFPARGITAAGLDAILPATGTAPRPTLTFGRLEGMLKGYIDLVCEHDGRYYVIDYKSNHLGNRPGAYTPERLERAVAASRYDLQYMLYSLAVHRYLASRIAGYDYERHFGGVRYLFLRGMTPAGGMATGVHAVRPDAAVIGRLDALFAGRGAEVA